MRRLRFTSDTPVVAALVTVLVGAILLAAYMKRFRDRVSGGAPVALLATRMEVPSGALLSDDMLVTHSVPEAYVEERQILAAEKSRVIGLRAAIRLDSNQTLAWTDLTSVRRDQATLSARVPTGMRAMSISHGARKGLGRLVRPGDRVDVLLTRQAQPGGDESITLVLLQNVLILAVGNALSLLEKEPGATHGDSVTLLLTVDQASLLAHAQRKGELSLTLRNGGDLQVNEGVPETTDRDVFVEEQRTKRQKRALIERVH